MVNILIWGTGKLSTKVYASVKREYAKVLAFIDNQKEKQGKEYVDGIMICAPDFISKVKYDYLILSVKNDEEIIRECDRLNISCKKIIRFWNEEWEYQFLDPNYKIIRELENKIRIYEYRLKNAPYEYGREKKPVIQPATELLENILKTRNSLCRFGDGELELMRGVPRGWFQDTDEKLQKRLKEVFYSDKSNVYIALADNFGSLEKYTESAADAIRMYLCDANRDDIMRLIDTERSYWDAYVTRPYIMYRDKKYAKKIFDLFKLIWDKRDLVIVEGEFSRLGIGNDLFTNAKSIHRLISPQQNAFAYYDKILDAITKNVSKDDLILLSLGQTATVLAYDLAEKGFQALDIGQIDTEYEWFMMGAAERKIIPGKPVAELRNWHTPDQVKDEVYESQIVWKWDEE